MVYILSIFAYPFLTCARSGDLYRNTRTTRQVTLGAYALSTELSCSNADGEGSSHTKNWGLFSSLSRVLTNITLSCLAKLRSAFTCTESSALSFTARHHLQSIKSITSTAIRWTIEQKILNGLLHWRTRDTRSVLGLCRLESKEHTQSFQIKTCSKLKLCLLAGSQKNLHTSKISQSFTVSPRNILKRLPMAAVGNGSL